jgi:hypothetical protein
VVSGRKFRNSCGLFEDGGLDPFVFRPDFLGFLTTQTAHFDQSVKFNWIISWMQWGNDEFRAFSADSAPLHAISLAHPLKHAESREPTVEEKIISRKGAKGRSGTRVEAYILPSAVR